MYVKNKIKQYNRPQQYVKPETSKHRNDNYISWWINLGLGMRQAQRYGSVKLIIIGAYIVIICMVLNTYIGRHASVSGVIN